VRGPIIPHGPSGKGHAPFNEHGCLFFISSHTYMFLNPSMVFGSTRLIPARGLMVTQNTKDSYHEVYDKMKDRVRL